MTVCPCPLQNPRWPHINPEWKWFASAVLFPFSFPPFPPLPLPCSLWWVVTSTCLTLGLFYFAQPGILFPQIFAWVTTSFRFLSRAPPQRGLLWLHLSYSLFFFVLLYLLSGIIKCSLSYKSPHQDESF